MEEILDQPHFEQDKSNVKYAAFWPRLGASLLDVLILLPFTLGLTYMNIVTWKSPYMLIALTLLGISYKPFMEAAYGATLGKMALNLKVKNQDMETASVGEVLLRNIFHITPSLISLFFSVQMFNDPGFESVSGFIEYTSFSKQFSGSQYISTATTLLTITDAIMLMVDQQSRSLHDRIAGTVVIVTK